jgi:succinate dehydrogenase / fumarate reductase, cytochrome b subunit
MSQILSGTAFDERIASRSARVGIVGLGYVLAHTIGNLKLYLSAEATDHYARWLREGLLVPILPEHVALWSIRLAIIAALVVHLHAAWSLTRMNRRARGTRYASRQHWVAADFAARTMRWTGVIVLLFILFHLANLTWGVQPAAPGQFVHGDVYANVVASFSRPAVAGFYLAANLALGVHLYHGVWSLFQSLGISHHRLHRIKRGLAIGFTLFVTGVNLTFPIAVLAGVVT